MKEIKSVSEYCDGNILVIPEALFGLKDVTVLHRNSSSVILYKNLEDDLVDVEFHTKSPCVIYIENGCEVITTADNNTYELPENTVVALPEGVNLHSDFVHSTTSLKAYLFFFDGNVINEYLAIRGDYNDNNVNEPFVCEVKDSIIFNAYFNSIKALYKSRDACKELFELKMIEFLHLLDMQSNGFVDNLKSNSTPPPKRNIIRLASKHIDSRLTVSDLANLSGRSISSFNRDFKKAFNIPPKRWLTERRMEVAKALIQNNRCSVTDVAIRLGYDNISNFIKLFKATYGITPKQFIQRL
ncbi:MAG: helix-turn-helix transcriptional regulator [Pseudomonadales bacterium]|nr:helix-turn-helix transcriptional regulator [Pseudomonadales bacterium]